MAAAGAPLRVFLVAGEESGDQLGAGLMHGLSARLSGNVLFEGVGGGRMAALGLVPLFPFSDLAVHGVTAVLTRFPRIMARMRQTVDSVLRSDPDVLVVIDSPDFNLRVARRVHMRRPDIPIVVYGSPTVWAWRPARAPWMAGFVDHVMALLPFEPDAHRRLGGPPCTYVGHPLLDRLASLRPSAGERPALANASRPTVLILPGSRRSEVIRLLSPFGEAIADASSRVGPIELLLPAVPHLIEHIGTATANWPIRPTIVEGEEAKFAAFRRAHAALAASGTATLELALAGVPLVVGYRLDWLAQRIKWLIKVPSIVLANLILDENVVPEFIDEDCTAERLSAALQPLLRDSPERARQLASFERLDGVMQVGGGSPTAKAAETVLAVISEKRPQRRFEIGM